MRWGLASGCFATALGIALLIGAYDKKVAPEKEFICTDDAKVVERHVGVKDAGVYSYTEMWRIEYVDGTRAYYVQPPGETCSVEIVNQ